VSIPHRAGEEEKRKTGKERGKRPQGLPPQRSLVLVARLIALVALGSHLHGHKIEDLRGGISLGQRGGFFHARHAAFGLTAC
jgi:hypothetical protein